MTRAVASRGAAAVAAVLGMFIVGTPPATAAPTQVAIVIRGQLTACVRWHSGMTGGDVLNAAADVTWGQHPPYLGFVLAINGVGPDPAKTFWSYWHGDGAGWSFSNYGATSYEPTPGTVEGWSLSPTGGGRTPPPPTSYSSVCHDAPSRTSAQPTPAPPPRAPAPATRPPTQGGPTASITAQHPVTSSPVPTGAPSHSPAPSRPGDGSSSATRTHPASSGASSSGGGAVVDISPAASARPAGSTGSPLPMALAAAVVVAIGGAAGVLAWRRRAR